MLQQRIVWHGRSYRRFRLEFPVRLKFQVGQATSEIETVSKDLSVGGLLLRSVRPVPTNTPVTFVLSVHGKHSVRPIHLCGEGEIVRIESDEAEGTYIMAVKCSAPVTHLEEFLPV